MHAKDRVYNAMKKLCLDRDKITALELSKMLDLSRQVVSHYLNRLLEENLVKKTSSRPVYWSIANVCETKNPSDKKDVFSNLIGAYGSQKKVIEQCKAAVNYPPCIMWL
ncbi:winged helix-turn-helix transcriptional regulator [Clostridium tyrobutyricum]|uniref:winged helix-turn-helix transcriptional regulator n=1 Tax=Clostridium tyrobutyricum TaxID=1519 RepID=UPI00057D75D9|nr:winged helix-turn-helix transcriptional regulator [Clostridium tyrobutyricum]